MFWWVAHADTSAVSISPHFHYTERKRGQMCRTLFSWNKEYAAHSKIESLTELVLYCRFALSEYEEGAQFFLQHDPSSSREVTYFKLLLHLMRASQKDLWVQFYQQAVHERVPVRDSLIRADQTIRETGRLPAYL